MPLIFGCQLEGARYGSSSVNVAASPVTSSGLRVPSMSVRSIRHRSTRAAKRWVGNRPELQATLDGAVDAATDDHPGTVLGVAGDQVAGLADEPAGAVPAPVRRPLAR